MPFSYKGVLLNQPGDEEPWGDREFQAFKDIIDKTERTLQEVTGYGAVTDKAITIGAGVGDGDALRKEQIVALVDETGGQLDKITEGGNTGYALKDDNRANKGDIGEGAVDLSYYGYSSTTCGATGENSHAEGLGAISAGTGSHAEGVNSEASGYASHAEGGSTKASAPGSHAEGYGAIASGSYSHAEGSQCYSTGEKSHAEGDRTEASGNSSHAEGSSTDATGISSHAEGTRTTSSAHSSHAEGAECVAGSDSSHAEGYDNNILETAPYGAHAEGSFCNDVGAYKQSVIGIGSGGGTRKDGRIMYTDGTMTLPEATPPLNEARGNKSVVILEQIQDFLTKTQANTLYETMASGVFSGGLISKSNNTTIGITAGSGHVTLKFADPQNPTDIDVSWIEQTITPTVTTVLNVFYVYVDSSGAIQHTVSIPNEAGRRDTIILGYYLTEGGIIKDVIPAPYKANQTDALLNSYIYYNGLNNSVQYVTGLAVDGTLGFHTTAGRQFIPHSSSSSSAEPSVNTIDANGGVSTPAVFNTYDETGAVIDSAITAVPKKWLNSGTPTALTGNDATIHYLYLDPAGNLYLQLGNTLRTSATDARDNLLNDTKTFVPYPVLGGGAKLVSQIYVSNSATSLNGILADIVPPAGIPSGGGVTVNTWDQAMKAGNATSEEAILDVTGKTATDKVLSLMDNGAFVAGFSADGKMVSNSITAKNLISRIASMPFVATEQIVEHLFVGNTNPDTSVYGNRVHAYVWQMVGNNEGYDYKLIAKTRDSGGGAGADKEILAVDQNGTTSLPEATTEKTKAVGDKAILTWQDLQAFATLNGLTMP